jgi:hypothetical protein
VQEIGEFLEKLGMPEYGECFAQNKIDLSVPPHLTDQDLKDIGPPSGWRVREVQPGCTPSDRHHRSTPCGTSLTVSTRRSASGSIPAGINSPSLCLE